jgi:hypothetical protein
MPDPNRMHVVPVGDTVGHDTSGDADCVCGPEVGEIQTWERGIVGHVVTHHSIDGREQRESTA